MKTKANRLRVYRFEILGSHPYLNDIDQNARDLDHFLMSEVHEINGSHNKCSLAILPWTLSGSNSQGPTTSPEKKLDLTVVYDNLVNDWLTNLSPNIPGHTRVWKENAVRELAAELVLARIRLTPELDPNLSPEHDDVEDQPDHGGNDVVGGISSSRRTMDHDVDDESPSSSLPQSNNNNNRLLRRSSHVSRTASSPISTTSEIPSSTQGIIGTDYSTLRSLTTVTRHKPLSGVASSIISTWQPGSDPETSYNWQSVLSQTRISTTTPTPPSSSTMSRRGSRSRSKTSGRLSLSRDSSRPRTSMPMSMATSPIREGDLNLMMTGGSQPQPQPQSQFEASSQVVAGEEEDRIIPMSQIERGVFGGKGNMKKKKKKKRAAGF